MDKLSSVEEPPALSSERLDSWKEIASYFRRGVRTVQRWEAGEDLPVHRHFHDKGGTVYAYKSELDAWWKERGASLEEPEGAEETSPLPNRSRTVFLVAAGFLLAVLMAGVAGWLAKRDSREAASKTAPLSFQARDWVLVASFANQTGEPLFDGTVEYALEAIRHPLSIPWSELLTARKVAQAARRSVSGTRTSPAGSIRGSSACGWSISIRSLTDRP